MSENNTGNASVTQPLNATVKGLGVFTCEQCGKEKEKRIYNQRFCSTPCRLAYHSFKPRKRKV